MPRLRAATLGPRSPSTRAGARALSRVALLIAILALVTGSTTAAGATFQNYPPSNIHLTWTEINTSNQPGYVQGIGLAYDAHDGYVLGFGGNNWTAGPTNQTWTYAGGTWTQLAPTVSPPTDSEPTLAYDGATRSVIFFGGQSYQSSHLTPLNETWSFAGGIWTQLDPARSPPPFQQHFMSYDVAAREVVLWGDGPVIHGGDSACSGQLWTYSSRTWTQLIPPGNGSSTGRLQVTAMAYDPTLGGIVAVGEPCRTPYALGQTWLLTNNTWFRLDPAREPGFRVLHEAADSVESLAFLPAGRPSAGYLVLDYPYGSTSGTEYQHLWVFSNGNWKNVNATNSPAQAWGIGMTYDDQDHALLQYGGYGESNFRTVLSSQTWTLA